MRQFAIAAVLSLVSTVGQAQSLTVVDSQMTAYVPASYIATSVQFTPFDSLGSSPYDDEYVSLNVPAGALGDDGSIGIDITGGAGFFYVASNEVILEAGASMDWSIGGDVEDGAFVFSYDLEATATVRADAAVSNGTVDLELEFSAGSIARNIANYTYWAFEFDDEHLYVDLDYDSWDDWDITDEFGWTPDSFVGFPFLRDTVYLTVDDGTEIDLLTACGQTGAVGPVDSSSGGPAVLTLGCGVSTLLSIQIAP